MLWKKTTDNWRLKDILPKLILHDVQLSDLSSLTSLLKTVKPKAIFHLAAHGAYSAQTNVQEMIDINIQGTYNLLMASKDVPYEIFINTGSSSEYGYKDSPMKETDLLVPNSFYAATKAAATHVCQVFSQQYKKPIVTFRLFSVYGPYEEKTRFIPTIMLSLIHQHPVLLTPGEQRRDFIYIDDVIDAYISSLRQNSALSGKICNIGTGIEYTNDEVVHMLFEVTRTNVDIQKGAYNQRSWDTPHWVADITYAQQSLKWSRAFTLKHGLLDTYQWFLDNQDLYEKK